MGCVVYGLQDTNGTGYRWRLDLGLSQPFWEGWFHGLSSLFLSIPSPKLLVLAAWDHIDTTLLLGQMQGKFETQVLQSSNHACHEDFPLEFSRGLFRFLARRNLVNTTSTATIDHRYHHPPAHHNGHEGQKCYEPDNPKDRGKDK